MVSKRFIQAYLLHGKPRYRLVLACGCEPSWLSRAVHGCLRIQDGDERIIKIGALLGLKPQECFSRDSRCQGIPPDEVRATG